MKQRWRGQAPSSGQAPIRDSPKRHVSLARQALIALMQTLGHGQIKGLVIRDREPVLDPSPCVVREIKFGAENSPRPELGMTDFLLKSQVMELFDYFDHVGNVSIDVLEIHRGLPFRISVTEAAA